jgi:hypothetical protein
MDEQVRRALQDDDVQRDLIRLVTHAFNLSANVWSNRYEAWQAAERRWKLVVSESEKFMSQDQKLFAFENRVVAPFTYAIVQSIKAFLLAVFTTRYPIFEARPLDGANEQQARLVEALLDYYFRLQGGIKVLDMFLLDVLRYGIGILKCVWERRVEKKRQRFVIGDLDLGVVEDYAVTYEGPRTINVDPFSFFPDPRVPLDRFQEGQFCGHLLYVPWWWLREKEKQGVYMFVDDIPPFTTSALEDLKSRPPFSIIGVPEWLPTKPEDMKQYGMVMVHELWARIVPSQYGLSDGDDVELWVITVANRSKVIRAEPSPYHHDKFPFVVGLYLLDAHANDPVGLIELLQPLQDLCTWLINSHLDNIEKVLNEVLIFDPSRIDPRDLQEWRPGQVIPLRPEAYGTSPADALYQFPVQLYTSQHLNTLEILLDHMQRLSGSSDILLGMFPATKRSATETAHVAQMGANRIQMLAQTLSATAIVPWAELMLALLQQFLTHPVAVRLLGLPAATKLAGTVVEVSPEDIQGRYYFPLHDGTAPLDPQKNADLWLQIFELIGRVPSLAERFDLVEIFRYMVSALGVRNIDQFLKEETPTEEAAAEASPLGALLAGAGEAPEGEEVPPGEMEPKERRVRPPLEPMEEMAGTERMETLTPTEA